MDIHRITPDVTVLSDCAPVPGIGFLPVNAFVLHAQQPVVVDTGLSTPDKNFLDDLAAVIDPADVRWIYITHPDRDHTGGLWQLMEAAPDAKLVTTFSGVGIMSTEWAVPLHRVHLLNPGQTLDVGDRGITAFRPPLFDNPCTTGFIDTRSGAMFTSDCFGAPMPTADVATAAEVAEAGAIRDAQLLWASIDSPWVHTVDQAKFKATIDPVRALRPSALLSTHLPAALSGIDALFDVVAASPSSPGFIGPDQAALEELLASFEPVG